MLRARIGLLGALLCGVPSAAAGQDAASVARETIDAVEALPSLDKTRAPDSPAFEILGASPTAIQRPTTLSQLAVNLGSFVGDGSLIVPKALSLEVAPYWLFPHPKLTLEAFEGERLLKVVREASFSVGSRSVEASTDAPAPYTLLAVGVRLKPYDGRPAVKCAGELRDLRAAAAQAAAAALVPADVQAELAARLGPGKALEDAVAEWKAAHPLPIETLVPRLSEACLNGASAREGLLVDVAGAAAWRFSTSAFDSGRLDDWAAWVTAGWSRASWSMLALARYQRSELVTRPTDALDLGARAVVATSRFSLSAECIYRNVSGHDARYRIVGIAEYAILPGSDTWLSVTYGRDALPTGRGDLVALANLKWGLGKKSLNAD